VYDLRIGDRLNESVVILALVMRDGTGGALPKIGGHSVNYKPMYQKISKH